MVDLESVAIFGMAESGEFGAPGALWRTDGTANGTFPVFGSSPYRVQRTDLGGSTLVASGPGRLYFRAYNEMTSKFHLAVTDGTVEGTHLFAGDLFAMRQRFFSRVLDSLFLVDDPEYDWSRLRIATASGHLVDLPSLARVRLRDGFTEYLGHVYFSELDSEGPDTLWRSDGTAGGTVPFLDGFDVVGSMISDGDWLYFYASDVDHPGWLWRSDGTVEGTTPVGPLEDLRSFIAVLGSRVLYLRAYTGGYGWDLWSTDGTPEGTVQLTHYSGPGDTQQRFNVTQLADRLVVAGGRDGAHFEGDHYRQLLITDGTVEGTGILVDCDPGCIPVNRIPGVVDGRVVFTRVDEEHGLEQWQTDGTVEGTRLLADLCPGPCDANGGLLDVVRGAYLYLRWGLDSTQPATSAELLWSDGPFGQIARLTDFAPDNPFGVQLAAATLGRRLVFAADDGVHGRELWVSEIANPPPSCVAGPTTLCLGENRFRLEVTWSDFTGNSGSGNAQPLTADTGTFWFFDPANLELIVKVLDATSINGFHWVFYGALSNVEYELTVTDTVTGESKTYRNPSGVFASAGDVEALADDATGVTTSARVVGEPVFEVSSGAPSAAACAESAQRLCLAGGRFAVEVAWADFEGGSGQGTTTPLTSDTGAFWFFDAANFELVVKVLDARALNGKFWVFYGALSNVEYTITVTDTATGAVKTYRNPSGQFASVGDTEAF